MEQLQRYLNHSKIDVVFKQSKDDFVVTEIPLYEFSGEGEHLVLKIRKKEMLSHKNTGSSSQEGGVTVCEDGRFLRR